MEETIIAYVRENYRQTMETEFPELFDDERIMVVFVDDEDFEDLLETETGNFDDSTDDEEEDE